MTIFVHIGTEKTGTTYIQNFLGKNRNKLLKLGYLYPQTPGIENHTKLAAYAQDDNTFDDLRGFLKNKTAKDVNKFRKAFKKELLAEVSKYCAPNILFSGEHCSSRLLTVQEVSRLKGLLDQLGNDIKIIVYLRRQDQLLLSTYSTWVKSGATGKLDLPSQRRTRERYDFAVLLGRWAAIFGASNLIVRPYDRDRFIDNDLLQDFAHHVGFKIGKNFVRASKSNPSLDAEVLELLRNMNFHMPGILDEGGLRMRGVLLKFLTQLCSRDGLTMESEKLKSFLRQFEHSNKHVAENYLDSEQPYLFREYEKDTTKVPQADLSPETISKMCAELWLQAYGEIQRLQERIKHLNEKLGK
jgi:hypothetical protein